MATVEEILGGAAAPPEPVSTPNEAPTEATESVVETQEAAPLEGEILDPNLGSSTAAKQVPLAALQEERAKTKRYTEQVADFERQLREQNESWQHRFDQLQTALIPKQPEEIPDVWGNPDGWLDSKLDSRLRPVGQALTEYKHELSYLRATAKYGEESVNEAYQEFGRLKGSNPQEFASEYQRIMGSQHPHGALVEWHKQRSIMNEVGNDPAAYKEKIKAEILAELNAVHGSPQTQVAKPGNGAAMPSNFATARNAGQRTGPAWAGPSSLEDIFAKR